jgi:hypothetical protein
MDNLNDLKAIWRTAKTDDLPGSAEMLLLVKKFRDKKLLNKILTITVAVTGIVLTVFAVLTNSFSLLSSKIGAVLTVLACIVLATTNIRSIKRFILLKDCSNREFILFLEQTRRNQLYYYKKTQVLGMALSSAGLLLYVYELAHKRVIFIVVFYAITIAWVLIMWLYIRPRSFKKQTAKLNETLERLKNISNQIE